MSHTVRSDVLCCCLCFFWGEDGAQIRFWRTPLFLLDQTAQLAVNGFFFEGLGSTKSKQRCTVKCG